MAETVSHADESDSHDSGMELVPVVPAQPSFSGKSAGMELVPVSVQPIFSGKSEFRTLIESFDHPESIKLQSDSGVDKSLPEALEEEFNNLSSKRPKEFKKILDALDKYGAYELDDLKIMPEEDVEKLDIKPFHRRSLMQYIEKLKVSEYDLDRLMCKTLGFEFDKLYSDRPQEFKKLLHALDRYGAYDLDVLREMPEEDVKKLDIKPPQRRDLMRFIKELNGGYDLDESLQKALGREFDKLYSDRPQEFKKLLHALERYGAYNLDILKKMPEEDVEKLDIKPPQRRDLMRFIKELNDGNEGVPASSQAIGNRSPIHRHGHEAQYFSAGGLLKEEKTSSYSPRKDVEVIEKPEHVSEMEDEKSALSENSEGETSIETLFSQILQLEFHSESDSSRKDAEGVEIPQDVNQLEDGIPDQDQNLAEVLEQKIKTEVVRGRSLVESMSMSTWKLFNDSSIQTDIESPAARTTTVQHVIPQNSSPKDEDGFEKLQDVSEMEDNTQDSSPKDVDGDNKLPDVHVSEMKDRTPDQDQNLAEVLEQKIKTEVVREKKTTLPYGWYGFGLTLLIAVFIGIWLRVDIEKGVSTYVRLIADQPSIRYGDQDLAAVLKRRIETEAFIEQIIGPEGGSVENFGCKITFPAGAVKRESKLKMSVITDFSGSPEGMAPVTPILQCVLDSKLELPVVVEMRSWVCPSESGVQSHLYRKDEGSDWTFVKFVPLTSDAKFIFSAQHFTQFGMYAEDVVSVVSVIQAIFSLPWPQYIRDAVSASFQTFLGLPMRLKIFLRIDDQGVVTLVCCLFDPKVIADVESSLQEHGFIHRLLMPETIEVPQGGKLSVMFTSNYPNTLKIWEIRDGVESTERKCERKIEVSELLNKIQHHEYFPLKIKGEDLVDYKGKIKASLSLKNGGSITHQISKRWPISEYLKTIHKELK